MVWALRLAAGLVLVLLVLLALAWRSRPDGYLHVFFLDVPGDALLIQTPDGSFVLVDGGADPVALPLHLGQHMPFWQRTLAMVILTHADEERLPGQVAALARYRARLAVAPAGLLPEQDTREWARLLDAQGTPVHIAQPGDQFTPGGGVRLTVLAAGRGDETGLVLRLQYGATSVLLYGAGPPPESASAPVLARPVSVLAYPWQYELAAPLLQAWQPRAIVFTDAQQARQPAQQSLYQRAQGNRQLYANLYHPHLHGTIELVSSGQHACIRRLSEPPCLPGAR
jgi:hypothetical protein